MEISISLWTLWLGKDITLLCVLFVLLIKQNFALERTLVSVFVS